MSTSAEPNIGQSSAATEIENEVDRLLLAQALQDFDVANARVVDLTQRLIGSTQELVRAREDLEALRREHEALRVAHEGMQRSRAFKLASRIAAIRNTF